MKVRILQPAVPPYRDAFYAAVARLGKDLPIELSVYGARTDFNGVDSVSTSSGYDAYLGLRFSVVGSGRWRLVWYWNWPSDHSDADIVVVGGNPRILNIYVELLRCRLLRIPVIWWGQGWAAGSRGIASKTRRMLMRLFDSWILYTESEEADYRKLGFDPDRICALNNGIDVERVRRSIALWPSSRLDSFKETHSLSGKVWIAFLGRFRERSGVEALIPALKLLPPDVGLLLVGDGPVRQMLEAQVADLGMQGRVRWAGSIFDEDLVAPWLLCSELLIYPGDVGLSLIHGFAYGLPAVVHNKREAHNPEISALVEGVNGWSFDRAGGASAIARVIHNALHDRSLLEEAKANAFRTVELEHNVERMAERMVSFLLQRRSNCQVAAEA